MGQELQQSMAAGTEALQKMASALNTLANGANILQARTAMAQCECTSLLLHNSQLKREIEHYQNATPAHSHPPTHLPPHITTPP